MIYPEIRKLFEQTNGPVGDQFLLALIQRTLWWLRITFWMTFALFILGLVNLILYFFPRSA